jgi:hypothetical protein
MNLVEPSKLNGNPGGMGHPMICCTLRPRKQQSYFLAE